MEESGVCVRVVGNLSLIPKDLLNLILVAMLMTKDNRRICLNIALFYTSKFFSIHVGTVSFTHILDFGSFRTGKDEMTNISDFVLNGIRNDESISSTTVNEDLIDQCLYTSSSAPPDIIVRTSGQYRLSDFLLWQVGNDLVKVAHLFALQFYFPCFRELTVTCILRTHYGRIFLYGILCTLYSATNISRLVDSRNR